MSCPCYETHEMYDTGRVAPPFSSPPLVIALAFSCFLTGALAVPANFLLIRDDSQSGNPAPKIWVSIMSVVVLFFFLFACGCSKRAISSTFARYTTARAAASSTNNARELTADQLAGSINRNRDSSNNANSTANGRPRRTRRPRRTPSQISTTSLPAYKKDPGEHELVIFRGPADLQDMPQPAATVMSAVVEDGEENSPREQSFHYTPMPHSHSDIPLLRGDGTMRQSIGSDSSHSLHRTDSNDTPDPRGEAPPYDEAVRTLPMESPDMQEVDLSESSIILPSPGVPIQPRMSGFRSFLNAMNPNRASHATQANSLRIGRERVDSNTSNVSSIASSSQARSASSHRPSPSTSTSYFMALSRQRSLRSVTANNLTSPSVISINSISAPLTHTAVRTEITYPKAGPTPEQIRAISSRNAFGRFAVPYGADAIAYATSASQQDLQGPPPDFDTVAPTSTSTAPRSRVDSTASDPSVISAISTVDAGADPDVVPLSPLASPPDVTTPINGEGGGGFVQTELATNPQAPAEEEPSSPTHSLQSQSSKSSSPPPNHSHQSGSSKQPMPPSSFHSPPTEFGELAESMASAYSTRSYATAAESMGV